MRTIDPTDQSILDDAATGKRINPVAFVQFNDVNDNWQGHEIPIKRALIRKGRDKPSSTASIDIFTRRSTSLSPLINAGKPIEYGSRVQIFLRYHVAWQLLHFVFDGYVDAFTLGKEQMTVECSDLMGRIMKRYTESSKKYGTVGGKQLHLVLQDLLNDWYPGVTLTTPHGTPSHTIKTREIQEGSLGQIMRDLALEIGWDVEYRWIPEGGTWGSWALSLIDPGRENTTSLYTFVPKMYREIPDMVIDGYSIRNKIHVPYVASGVRDTAEAKVSDATLTFQGVLFARLGENQNFKFTSEATAQAAANLALNDLKDPYVAAGFKTPLFPFVELDDIYTFQPPVDPLNLTQFNTNQKLAVVGFEHYWEQQGDGVTSSTTLQLRGKPTGGSERWANHFTPVEGPGFGDVTAPDAITGLTGDFTTPNAILSWNGVENAIGYKVTLTTLGAMRRIDYPTSPHYEYSLAANKADHTNPVASLSFEIRSLKMVEGAQLVSSPTVLALTNQVPPAPTSLVAASAVNHVIVTMAQPTFGDFLEAQVEVSTTPGFNSIHDRYIGTAYQGIRLSVAATGMHYIRARFIDVFNQASSWTEAQVEATLITGSQLGSIYFSQLLGQILEGQFGTNVVSADAIKSEAILARHLAIGDTANSFPDPRIKDLPSWTIAGAWTYSNALGNTYFNGSGFFSGSSVADHDLRSPFFDIIPNTPYAMTFKAQFNSTGTIEIYWEDGVNSGTLIGSFNQASTVWGGTFTTPTNYNRIRLLIRRKSSGGGTNLVVGNFVVNRRFGGNFIVDGDAVVSRDIMAGGAIRAGTPSSYRADLVSGGLKVYDGTNTQRIGLGDISGKAWGDGTLAANTWGLWGGRGAGVYLQDYPLVIRTLTASIDSGTQSISAATTLTFTGTSSEFTFASYVIASGRKVIPVRTTTEVASTFDGLVLQGFKIAAEMYNGSSWVELDEFSSGTYTKIRFQLSVRGRNTTGSTINSAYFSCVINAILLDAPSSL